MIREYKLELDQFSGPTEKLLELIETKKLDITEISLAEVTADFLSYLQSLEEVSPKVLADFVAVAARLIIIKSKVLLPQLELSALDETMIAELEERLRFYQEFRPAERQIKSLWQTNLAFAREYLAYIPPGFYLTEQVEPARLEEVFKGLIEELAALSPAVKEEKVKLVSLEEKIGELLEKVNQAFEASFKSLTAGKDKSEVVILFLALLQLLKEAVIRVEQKHSFSDIKIFSNHNERSGK